MVYSGICRKGHSLRELRAPIVGDGIGHSLLRHRNGHGVAAGLSGLFAGRICVGIGRYDIVEVRTRRSRIQREGRTHFTRDRCTVLIVLGSCLIPLISDLAVVCSSRRTVQCGRVVSHGVAGICQRYRRRLGGVYQRLVLLPLGVVGLITDSIGPDRRLSFTGEVRRRIPATENKAFLRGNGQCQPHAHTIGFVVALILNDAAIRMIGDRADLRGLIHLQEPALRSFLYRQYSASVQGGHCAVLLRTRHYQGRDGHAVRHFALCLQRQALALQFILNRDLPKGLEVDLLHLLEAGDRYLFSALLINRGTLLCSIVAEAAAGDGKRSIGPDSAAVSAGGVALIAAAGDGQAVGRVEHAAIALGAVIPEHAALQGYTGARLILIGNAALFRRAVVLKRASRDGKHSVLQPEYAAAFSALVI